MSKIEDFHNKNNVIP